MKLEMGESLALSWLKHVKGCQIVQTNWKVSNEWKMHNEEKLYDIMNTIDNHFKETRDYDIFKMNTGLEQVLSQGESDLVGISMDDNHLYFYFVEVAFHLNGLHYGSKEKSTMKILEKMSRSALSLFAYLGGNTGEIVFASPKIGNNILSLLEPAIKELEEILNDKGLAFKLRLIYNEAFNNNLLSPVLDIANKVSDTSELFLRSYQLYTMFFDRNTNAIANNSSEALISTSTERVSEWEEFSIGKLANIFLREMLATGAANKDELALLEDKEYSKKTFGIQYPLLSRNESAEKHTHYYAKPLRIDDQDYWLCNEWYEQASNNDRPLLEKWMQEHMK